MMTNLFGMASDFDLPHVRIRISLMTSTMQRICPTPQMRRELHMLRSMNLRKWTPHVRRLLTTQDMGEVMVLEIPL